MVVVALSESHGKLRLPCSTPELMQELVLEEPEREALGRARVIVCALLARSEVEAPTTPLRTGRGRLLKADLHQLSKADLHRLLPIASH